MKQLFWLITLFTTLSSAHAENFSIDMACPDAEMFQSSGFEMTIPTGYDQAHHHMRFTTFLASNDMNDDDASGDDWLLVMTGLHASVTENAQDIIQAAKTNLKPASTQPFIFQIDGNPYPVCAYHSTDGSNTTAMLFLSSEDDSSEQPAFNSKKIAQYFVANKS
tara:strand:+ start:1505 stop:1996 length:492 start_codon:yes stop_codon:yes gene_type:complete